jgi:hypothetical protein
LRKYWGEILGAILLALGIFLLVEKLEIKAVIYSKLVWLVQQLGRFFSSLFSWVGSVEFSDYVGLLLVVGAVVLIGARFRARIIKRHADRGPLHRCPKCGERTKRVPGRIDQRMVAFLFRVRIRRYTCRKCSHSISWWERKLATRD